MNTTNPTVSKQNRMSLALFHEVSCHFTAPTTKYVSRRPKPPTERILVNGFEGLTDFLSAISGGDKLITTICIEEMQ